MYKKVLVYLLLFVLLGNIIGLVSAQPMTTLKWGGQLSGTDMVSWSRQYDVTITAAISSGAVITTNNSWGQGTNQNLYIIDFDKNPYLKVTISDYNARWFVSVPIYENDGTLAGVVSLDSDWYDYKTGTFTLDIKTWSQFKSATGLKKAQIWVGVSGGNGSHATITNIQMGYEVQKSLQSVVSPTWDRPLSGLDIALWSEKQNVTLVTDASNNAVITASTDVYGQITDQSLYTVDFDKNPYISIAINTVTNVWFMYADIYNMDGNLEGTAYIDSDSYNPKIGLFTMDIKSIEKFKLSSGLKKVQIWIGVSGGLEGQLTISNIQMGYTNPLHHAASDLNAKWDLPWGGTKTTDGNGNVALTTGGLSRLQSPEMYVDFDKSPVATVGVVSKIGGGASLQLLIDDERSLYNGFAYWISATGSISVPLNQFASSLTGIHKIRAYIGFEWTTLTLDSFNIDYNDTVNINYGATDIMNWSSNNLALTNKNGFVTISPVGNSWGGINSPKFDVNLNTDIAISADVGSITGGTWSFILDLYKGNILINSITLKDQGDIPNTGIIHKRIKSIASLNGLSGMYTARISLYVVKSGNNTAMMDLNGIHIGIYGTKINTDVSFNADYSQETISIQLKNQLNSVSGKLMAVAYDIATNKLVNSNACDVSLPIGNVGNYQFIMPYLKGKNKICLYFWDSYESIKPLPIQFQNIQKDIPFELPIGAARYKGDQFPTSADFGLGLKSLSKADLGLSSDQAYILYRLSDKSAGQARGFSSYDEQMLINSITGLCNRNTPAVYIDHTYWGWGGDPYWMNYYTTDRGINYVRLNDWRELLNKVKGSFNGVVVYDGETPSFTSDMLLAFNVANINNCLPVSRKIYDNNRAAFNGLPVIAYFEKGHEQLKTYDWLTLNVLPLTDKHDAFNQAASLGTDASDVWLYRDLKWNDTITSLDYAFYKKMFIFNLPHYDFLPTFKYFEGIMTYLEKPAIVWGWSSGVEAVYSMWGHAGNECSGGQNMSFHAAMPMKNPQSFPFVNPTPSVSQPVNKVYIAFSTHSGDSFTLLENMHMEAFNSSSRGQIPMNWMFPSSYLEHFPAMMEYFFQKASAKDYFLPFYTYGYFHYEAMSRADLAIMYQKNNAVINTFFEPKANFNYANAKIEDWDLMSQYNPNYYGFIIRQGNNVFPYGWQYKLPSGQAVIYPSADTYMWTQNSRFARFENNKYRMNIDNTIAYLNEVYEKVSKPAFIEFADLVHNLPADVVDMVSQLDKNKFEVVDYGTMLNMVQNMPSQQIEQRWNHFLSTRQSGIDAKNIQKGVPETTTQPINYIKYFADNNVVKNYSEIMQDGDNMTFFINGKINGEIKSPNGSANYPEFYNSWAVTNDVYLPLDANYAMIDTRGMTGQYYQMIITGNFGDNGAYATHSLLSFSYDAMLTRGGRVSCKLPPEITSYIQNGYPVKLHFLLSGPKTSKINVENLAFTNVAPLQ